MGLLRLAVFGPPEVFHALALVGILVARAVNMLGS